MMILSLFPTKMMTGNNRERLYHASVATRYGALSLCCMIVILLLLGVVVSGQHDSTLHYTKFDDASWAITSAEVQGVLGNHVKPLYDDYIDKCQVAVYDKKPNSTQKCTQDDNWRMIMNRDQPGSVYNYTKVGYSKIKTPKPLLDKLMTFYKDNEGTDKTEWSVINTYHNMWETPPSILMLNQPQKVGGGSKFQKDVWELIQPILEEWTQQQLKPVSLYGIRFYHNNSILAPHVDRMPLISSCISKLHIQKVLSSTVLRANEFLNEET